MQALSKTLKNLGLSQEEIDIYLYVLGRGTTTVLDLARQTRIPRTTIYLLVENMLGNGLLLKTVKGKKKYLLPALPESLLQLAHEKKHKIQNTISRIEGQMPELEALFNLKQGKPRVYFFEGVEGVKQIYEETLKSENIYLHCTNQEADEIMGGYMEKYIARVAKSMIHTQEIVADTPGDRTYQKQHSTQRNKIICIPKKYTTNTNYLIYEDKVVFITYKNADPVAVVIQDPEIAHFERIRFLMVWDLFTNKD